MAGSFVVTGAGLVTAGGDTPESVFATVSAGTPLTTSRPDDDLAVAEMTGFDAKRYIARKGVKDLSRLSQLACSAAAANARGIEGVAPGDVGVVFGSAWGSLTTVVTFEREAHVQGSRFVDPILFTETVSNVPAGQVAILYGWSAFNVTVSAGCASGLAGISQAVALLQEGRARVAVAGGGDELGLPVLRALRLRGPIPVGGEGACFLTVESEEHAKERGAPALAKILGSAECFVPSSAAGSDSARTSMEGLLRDLLARAEIRPEDVGLVVLSADETAVDDVFGCGPAAPSVMLPKSILGETWGASGAIASVLAIEAMRGSSARNAVIIDRTDSGHQFGLVLSVMERHGDPR